jgi:hypothetical protein
MTFGCFGVMLLVAPEATTVGTPACQSKFKRKLTTSSKFLATRKRPKELAKELDGSCEGLTEIIVELLGADEQPEHYRLLGFLGPGKMEFTLLFEFQKRIDSDYGAACRSALIRKEGVLRDGRRAPPCE